jgi:hypothetical protein
MASRALLLMAVGLVVVAALIFFMFGVTTGAHLRLDGKILKVRVYPQAASGSSLVFAEFRLTNPSDVPFVVESVKLRLEPVSGDSADANVISKVDTENVFRYLKILGPQYNDVLAAHDRITPHQTMDRMAGARFEVPEAIVDGRKSLRIVITDVDGAVAEITDGK